MRNYETDVKGELENWRKRKRINWKQRRRIGFGGEVLSVDEKDLE